MNLPIPDQQNYRNVKPFPHCVIDNVFQKAELNNILNNWPAKHEHYAMGKYEAEKGTTVSERAMGVFTANFIKRRFQSQEFILFLEALTGITGLVCDCRKFALHETFAGGSLSPHLDYTISKTTGLQLRVNAILYLNENWKPEYNGNLELYDRAPMYGGILYRPVVSVEPLFNRLVIFTMDAEAPAWHGHSKPLNVPQGMSRRSIALNYFTLPQAKAVEQGTIFKKSILKEVLPPVVYRLIRKEAKK